GCPSRSHALTRPVGSGRRFALSGVRTRPGGTAFRSAAAVGTSRDTLPTDPPMAPAARPPARKRPGDGSMAKKDLGKELLVIVEKMQEEKKTPREVIFHGIEPAIQLAAERHFGVEEGVAVVIDQSPGHITARHGEQELDPETLGRIAAQSAKQVMIQ